MRHWWRLGAVALLVVAVLWGLGIPGRATPGGPDAPAAVAARARAAEIAATKAASVRLAVGLKLAPKRRPAFTATFTGTKLDTKVWDTCFPLTDSRTGCTDFGNKEFQWYMPTQDQVSGGILKLVAQRTPTPGKTQDGKPTVYGCRSGMVTTYHSLRFEYGFLQVVAKIPHGHGLWSALWLAAVNNKWPPEMDLIENWSSHYTGAFFHPAPASVKQILSGEISQSLSDGWQVYSLRWTSTTMKYWVGNKLVLTIRQRIPHQKMYFIADVAAYAKAATGNCSGMMQIRSVKYWK